VCGDTTFKLQGNNMNYKTKCKHCENTTTTKEKLLSWICSSCTIKYTFMLKAP